MAPCFFPIDMYMLDTLKTVLTECMCTLLHPLQVRDFFKELYLCDTSRIPIPHKWHCQEGILCSIAALPKYLAIPIQWWLPIPREGSHTNTEGILVENMTCSQCYKRFTGLYLQVCKNRPTLKIISGHKCCLIPNYHAFLLKNLVFKSENRHHHGEIDYVRDFNWF